MTVSKRLRFEVLRRDNYTCRYCGAKAPDVPLRVDHVIPEALGGTDDPTNLVTACEPCNTGKSSVPLDAPIVAQVAADAQRWSRALQLIADDRRQQRAYFAILHADFLVIWFDWRDHADETSPLPDDWRDSITRFHNSGLGIDDFSELVSVAMRAKTAEPWKYFCGCCWTRIRETHEVAALLLQEAPIG